MGGSGKYVAFVGLTTAAGPPRRRGYILFKTFDEKWEEPGHGDYYGVIDLNLARAPQSLLAYDMNGIRCRLTSAHRCACGWKPNSDTRW